jgi:hypothetical protein
MGDWTQKYRGIKGQPLIPEKVTKYWHDQKPYSGTEKFIDESFPPTSDSILSVGNVWCQNHQKQLESMGEWKFLRPEEFLEGDFCVYDNLVSQNDIMQGSLGDCYFLASLAAMTEFPGLINQNFKLGGERSHNGYYEILFFIDEEWQIVIVDDNIPVLQGQSYPTFCRSSRNVIWMMLLEKAWAKINGGFSNIIAGKACWPLHITTGFPCNLHYFQNFSHDSLWNLISYYDQRNDIMTCSTKKDGNGIVSSHQYTLRFAGEVKDPQNQDVVHKLVCLRNPWGSYEWKGDWSDNSDKWTPELKKLLGVEGKDDGVFYMTFDDFLEYFDGVDVAHSPNYNKSISTFTHTDYAPKVYNVYIENLSTLCVNVHANDLSDLQVSLFLSRYNRDNYHFENLQTSHLVSSSIYDGRIYNLSQGYYSIAVYPHCEKEFTLRFSNNGSSHIKPYYFSDSNLIFAQKINLHEIPEEYHKQIKSVHEKNCVENYGINLDSLWSEALLDQSIWKNCEQCNEYQEVKEKLCLNDMICVDIKDHGFSNFSTGYHPQESSGNSQMSTKKKVVVENHTLLSRSYDCNYRYLRVFFPHREIEKVTVNVTMRDQGWTSSDCSGSWIEAVVEDLEGKEIVRKTIFSNLAVPSWKEYSLEITPDHELFNLMNANNTLNIYAKSAWGWEIWVKSASCIID